MSGNTATPSGNRSSTSTAGLVAGLLAFTAAITISYGSVLIGEGLTYSQVTSPVIGGVLWPVSAGLAVAFTLIAALFIMMVALGMIGAIATPELRGRTEYTIIGAGGLLGTAAAALTSAGTWVTGTDLLGGSLPTGSGESLAALAVVAVPLGYVFYELYKPDMTPVSTGQPDADTLDPEFVRQETERWSDKAAATPASQQNQSRPTQPSSPDSPDTQRQAPTGNPDESDENPANTGTEDSGADSFDDLEYRWVRETDVSFDDVGGMEDLKQELQRDVIKPLVTHPEKAEELGVSAPNIIFHGPPGTGKTYMAKAMATELGLPFAQLSGADVQSKWINESAQKVKTLFEEAKTVAEQEGGAVVFLDELDSVLKDRGGSGNSHEEDKKVVNEFLNHLEDTDDHNIVFVGATNRLDSLDEAGIRSGRIDKKVHVGKPDQEARAAIIRAQLGDRPHDLSEDEIQKIAAGTDGLVAADLELVVKNAAKQVLARDGEGIQWQDMEKAVAETA